MGSLMCDTITFLRKRSWANGAAKRSFARVRSTMIFQCVHRAESHRTEVARMRPFARMDALMFHHRTGRCESVAAHITNERMGSGMFALVRAQLTFADERGVASVTFVRLRFVVSHQMLP